MKTCPCCGAVVFNAAKKCPGANNDGGCGHVFGAAAAAAAQRRAAVAAVAEAEAGNGDERRTSRRARGLSAQIVPPKEKDWADCHSAEQRARALVRVQASDAQRAATLVRCCSRRGCGTEKPRSDFSAPELRKGRFGICRACSDSKTVKVTIDVSIRAADGETAATLQMFDDAAAPRCKVVVELALKALDADEPDGVRQERARAALRGAISRNGSAYANVVRVDNVPTDCCIPVQVSEDDAGFYAMEKAVRRSLAATEGGTRARPKPNGTQEKLFNDDGCDFMKAARDLFDPARSQLAFAATLRRLRGDLPKPGDKDFYLFARKASFPNGFDKELPNMNDDIFIAQCGVPAAGGKCWTHYGNTPKEALEKCLRQGRCNVFAQVYDVKDETLLAQIAAGHVEKLAGLNLQAEVYSEHLVADVTRALKGPPFDVEDMKDRNWKKGRLLGASMAAAGVTFVRGNGGFVYKTRGPNPQEFTELKDAMEYALKDSPTLMRLELDAKHKWAWEQELDDEIVASSVELSEAVASRRDRASRRTGDVPTHLLVSTQAQKLRLKRSKASSAGSNAGEPWGNCRNSLASFTKVLECLGERSDVVLVACNAEQFREMHVGYSFDTGEAHPEAVALYERAASSVGCLDVFDQEALLGEFDQIATKEGYKMDLLRKAYGSKLNDDQLSFLEDEFVFAATFPHDYAPIEAIRLMPKPLAKFTKAFPGYWTTEDCAWNRLCFNMALVRFNAAVEEAETRKEYEAEMGL